MKRILSLLLAAVAAFAVCLTLGSCDNDHTHKYKTEWSSDEDFHWYACESDGCTSQSQKAEHTFEEDADADGKAINVCTVCGYVYEGDELPEDYECPLCGVGPEQFEEEETEEA